MTNALLSSDPHNHLVIAYNLIVDNKRIADESKSFVSTTEGSLVIQVLRESLQPEPPLETERTRQL